jgi:hypothetical protein
MKKRNVMLAILIGSAISGGVVMADEKTPVVPKEKEIQCVYAGGVVKLGEVVQNQPQMPKGMAMVCAKVHDHGVFLVVAKSSLKSL